MSNFNQTLEKLLKQHLDFIDNEGDLYKAKVIDSAWKVDPKLIELLLENREIKAKFFTEIKGHWVFNVALFVAYIQDKNFLSDSWTNFKNKIGLMDGNKFLNQKNDIALVWPFKDCILEGGQTDEESKRKEIFFNEILAQDEIDVLLDPKVLTNSKKYTKDGKQAFDGFTRDQNGTIKDNLIIKGNNLLALHTLKTQFSGKVKLIYIDPPYNTGNDGFRYNDNFNHSTWLTFMKNRLEVARELLRDDGVIFVQCDDNEQAYLKVLMDEIFGEICMVNTICVKMSHLSGVKMSHNDKKLPKIKEYIHVFSKKSIIKINPVFVSTSWKNVLDRYNSYLVIDKNDPDNCSKWKVKSLNETFSENNISTEEEKNNFVLNNARFIFRTARNKSKQIEELPNDNIFRKIKTPTGLDKYIYKKEEVLFASDKLENDDFVEPVGDIWNDIGINNLHNEGSVDFQLGKKPEKLIQRIIEMSTQKGDIVLDYHLGSGTTAAVAHKMGRQYIGIEQMDYIETIAVERLKKVIGKSTPPSKDGTPQEGNFRQLTGKEKQQLQVILAKLESVGNSLM